MFTKYPTQIKEFDLGKYGKVNYHQWLHPYEGQKTFTEGQIDLLRKYIKEGDVVIDIGAHTGDTTVPYAVATGPTGKVIAFEPNPAVFPVLLENSRVNLEFNIVPSIYAILPIDCGPEVRTFHYSDRDFCNGGSMDTLGAGIGSGGHSWPIEVRGISLNAWMKKHAPHDKVSFIKIDAEGADKDILESIAPLIQASLPVIQVELYDKLLPHEKEKLFDVIDKLNYFCYDFSIAMKDIDQIGSPITRESIVRMNVRSGHDLICLPKK